MKEGLKCRFVIEERVAGGYDPKGNGNHLMFRLLGVEAITVVPAGSDMGKAMQQVADALAAEGRKAYVIPGGGSNALGGLGYVACAQELQQQWFELGLAFDRVVVGSGSSGTHGGLVAGFLGDHVATPIVGIGTSRDPAEQEPLVLREAQAVLDLLGVRMTVPKRGGGDDRRLVAAEVLGAERADGRGGADAGAHAKGCCSTRSTPARRWPG